MENSRKRQHGPGLLFRKMGFQNQITVSRLAEEWMVRNRNQMKPSTHQKYESLIQNHICRYFGRIPAASLTCTQIERFSNELLFHGRMRGGGLSRKTVNDILILLSQILRFCEEEYGIPCTAVRCLKIQKKRERVLSIQEQDRLLDYLLDGMDIYKFAVFLALYTGIRIGELCALQWIDVLPDGIHVSKTMQRLRGAHGRTEIFLHEPKSESARRVIPLPSFLKEFIEQFRRPSGYVLQTDRLKYIEPRLMQKKFERMTKECGLEQVHFHSLRHTFATRCMEAGFDIKTLSEILGHSDVKTTLNRYVHSSPAVKQNNMDKLSLPFSSHSKVD